MPDIYAETVRKMSDYVTSRLTGSDDSCKRVFSDKNPSKFIIVGSLANIVPDEAERKSSVNETSITLKFKTKKVRSYVIRVNYSIYVEDVMTSEEANEHTNTDTAWQRIDYLDSFTLNPDGSKKPLRFDKSAEKNGYAASIIVSSEDLDGVKQVCIRVQNESVNKKHVRYLFNLTLEVEVSKNEIVPYDYVYYYEGLRQSFKHDYRSINCTASFNEEGSVLITSPIPTYSQIKEKLKTTDKGFDFKFSDLASDKCISVLERYLSILDEYSMKYESLEVPDGKSKEYELAMDTFRTIRDEYSIGLETLRGNYAALKAFELMNKTFQESSEHDSWRMFQIIFIIISIPKVIRVEGSGVCDVIHIPTGGGKTEAYLGVSVFLMFYTRLTGKIAGTISIVKFPLRMLSIQQIERVAIKVVFAEKIRVEEKIGD